ncbi:hypothetical protein E2C01_003971 [Portunus trituberculatus]|uniref:Uncharacterized protein n=1 Tax=Portunus trituberculatus TaxID=210409 RepID=A0A5B7CQ52_PORTR|nr:hypothetical protein [Portunus trituberculatus]
MARVFTILIPHISFRSCIKSPNSKQNEYGNVSWCSNRSGVMLLHKCRRGQFCDHYYFYCTMLLIYWCS